MVESNGELYTPLDTVRLDAKPWDKGRMTKLSAELHQLSLVESYLEVQLRGIRDRKVDIRAEISDMESGRIK